LIAGKEELTVPNSKRVRLEKASGWKKTYSQNELCPPTASLKQNIRTQSPDRGGDDAPGKSEP